MTQKDSFGQRFGQELGKEFSGQRLLRDVVNGFSLALALWLSGLLPMVSAFVGTHQHQLLLTIGLFLIFRAFWPLIFLLPMVFLFPLGWLERIWLARRQKRSVTRE